MRVLVTLLCAATVACAPAPVGEPFVPAQTQRVTVSGFSLSFEVPAEFVPTDVAGGVAHGGPKGSPTFFTPIVVQPRSTQAPLSEVLDGLIQPWAEHPSFELHRRTPIATGGVIALLYELSFELHDAPRRRLAVLVPTPGGVVDIALAANSELLAQALPIFDHVLDSLIVTEREPRD
ncbi:MAG: hypothetical protein AAFY60_08715 [Myxococcota bacterium]